MAGDTFRAIALAVIASVATVAIAACSSKARTPAPASSEYYLHADARKAEILDLWMQIREWRVEAAGLSANPDRTLIAMVFASSIYRLRICPKQPKPKTPKCTDACNIKDAICDNAEDICRIAKELVRDSWARDKCSSAKASCKEARDRCCKCISKEPRTPAATADDVPQLPRPF